MSLVQDIAFVRYQVTDLNLMEAFLADFGLHTAARTEQALYSRTAGPLHHAHIAELGPANATVGIGLLARSAQALDEVARRTGKPVEPNPEPGGGLRVRCTDPAGFVVDVIHGQDTFEPLAVRAPLEFNAAVGRKRLGQPVRLKPQVASITRLGHVALLVADFPATLAFYRDVLGFLPSDTYWAGSEDRTIAAFMRCGLGQQWTDHHTVALITASDGRNRFDHSAFEVVDFDDLVQSGEWLKSRGRAHSWGVGRHIQGSQLFDYWRDPFGNKVEHWTDGDLVNDSTPVGHAAVSPEELRQWAPAVTPEFFA
ncbi:MAG: VOC family protein [Proteobacteria bacterium]|nr:VOC family protein [Pseudomonadota bacterium]